MKKSLKERFQELSDKGLGFYSFENEQLERERIELYNKVVDFLNRLASKNGCLFDSSYYHLVNSAIYHGKFTFAQFKRNLYSTKDILKMLNYEKS